MSYNSTIFQHVTCRLLKFPISLQTYPFLTVIHYYKNNVFLPRGITYIFSKPPSKLLIPFLPSNSWANTNLIIQQKKKNYLYKVNQNTLYKKEKKMMSFNRNHSTSMEELTIKVIWPTSTRCLQLDTWLSHTWLSWKLAPVVCQGSLHDKHFSVH